MSAPTVRDARPDDIAAITAIYAESVAKGRGTFELEPPDEAEMAQLRQRVYEKAERESNAYFATSRLWDDGLLAPTDTRNALGMALSAAAHAPIADPHYGIFRF